MPREPHSLGHVDAQVGERGRARRQELGLSQSKLAEALGITFQQIQKYEKGRNRIGSSRLQMIADTLRVTPSYFFTGLPEHKPGHGSAHPTAFIQKFVASEDGMALIQAFRKISRSDVRRRIIALVESLAGPEK